MIKYLIMDIDGSLTDGKIYMGPKGEAMKAFSIKDGYVINYILKPANIIPVVITARTSSIVQNRCDELGIKEVHQGKLNKLSVLKDIVGSDSLRDCAYFGDDIIDMKCMSPIKEAGGIVGCPSDAVQEVKAIADYICVHKAGEGALREFSEWLVSPKIDFENIKQRIKKAVTYLSNLTISEKDAGKKIIVDDKFFYTIQSYNTKPEGECILESHKRYVDIQLMIHGKEIIDIVDISRLVPKEKYNYEKDVIYWHIPDIMARTSLIAGDCIVLYPENAHRGSISSDECSHVIKVVGKVCIE